MALWKSRLRILMRATSASFLHIIAVLFVKSCIFITNYWGMRVKWKISEVFALYYTAFSPNTWDFKAYSSAVSSFSWFCAYLYQYTSRCSDPIAIPAAPACLTTKLKLKLAMCPPTLHLNPILRCYSHSPGLHQLRNPLQISKQSSSAHRKAAIRHF
jgi:hypothetical protein